jgi:hypothetical protein
MKKLDSDIVVARLLEWGCEPEGLVFVYTGNHQKIRVRWKRCGHITEASYNNIQNGRRCRLCSGVGSSKMELDILFKILRPNYPDAVTQFPLSDCGNPQRLDLFVPSLMLAFEIQGPRHDSNHQLFDLETVERDKRKKNSCKSMGIRLVCLPHSRHEDCSPAVRQALIEELPRLSDTIKGRKLYGELCKKLPQLIESQQKESDIQKFVKWSRTRILAHVKTANYKNVSEWIKNSNGSRKAAKLLGAEFEQECLAHMLRPPKHAKYTDEELIEDARLYTTIKEWSHSHAGAYTVACSRGILAACCSHMPKPANVKYTDEELLTSARKYKHRSDWQEQDRSKYVAAHKRGKEFVSMACSHMDRPHTIRNGCEKSTRHIVDNNGEEYTGASSAARKLNICESSIRKILKGKQDRTRSDYSFTYTD